VDDLVLDIERYANLVTHKLYSRLDGAGEGVGVAEEQFTR
jgi:hypothetical protein